MSKLNFESYPDDPIELLDLPADIFFRLKKHKIESISQLQGTEYLAIKGIGPVNVNIIDEHLRNYLNK